MEILQLDSLMIQEYEMDRYPYLMIDRATEVIPGKSAKGYKNLSANEWFFPVHFEGFPCMPGMLQVEALIQMGALAVLTLPGNKGKIALLRTAKDLQFLRNVVPGDRLDMECEVLSWRRGIGTFHGEGKINGELACRADYTLALPDILAQYAVKK